MLSFDRAREGLAEQSDPSAHFLKEQTLSHNIGEFRRFSNYAQRVVDGALRCVVCDLRRVEEKACAALVRTSVQVD